MIKKQKFMDDYLKRKTKPYLNLMIIFVVKLM